MSGEWGIWESLQAWMCDNGVYSIGDNSITLHDYDGDEGITFERETLEEACDLAYRLQNEVQGPDDVGVKESTRQLRAWLKKNDPSNPALVWQAQNRSLRLGQK